MGDVVVCMFVFGVFGVFGVLGVFCVFFSVGVGFGMLCVRFFARVVCFSYFPLLPFFCFFCCFFYPPADGEK